MSSDVKAGGGEPRRWTLRKPEAGSGVGCYIAYGATLGVHEEVVVVPEVDFDAVVRERDEARAEAGGLEIVAARRLDENRELRERVRVLAEALQAARAEVEHERALCHALDLALWGDKEAAFAALSKVVSASVADSDPEGEHKGCPRPREACECIETCVLSGLDSTGADPASSSGGVTPEGPPAAEALHRIAFVADPADARDIAFQALKALGQPSSAGVDEGGEAVPADVLETLMAEADMRPVTFEAHARLAQWSRARRASASASGGEGK